MINQTSFLTVKDLIAFLKEQPEDAIILALYWQGDDFEAYPVDDIQTVATPAESLEQIHQRLISTGIKNNGDLPKEAKYIIIS